MSAAWELWAGGTHFARALYSRPAYRKPRNGSSGKCVESPWRPGRSRATPFPPEVGDRVSTCRPSPLPPGSGSSAAAAMEPAGLEQILRELLLPDTKRIRRVRGRRDLARASGRLWERPNSDPRLPAGHRAAPDRSLGPRRLARALQPTDFGHRPSGEAPAPP
jgi:hypothetical protein